MKPNHMILELRTGRDSEHGVLAMIQFYQSLPTLHNSFFNKIFGKQEVMSLEILAVGQTIFFFCYCPTRLQNYLQSSLQACFPQILITPLTTDPVAQALGINHNSQAGSSFDEKVVMGAKLKLASHEINPLKSASDYTEITPVATLLSTLSKVKEDDSLLVQLLLAQDDHRWQSIAYRNLHSSSSVSLGALDSQDNSSSSEIDSAVKRKLESFGIKASINLLSISNTHEAGGQLLDDLAGSIITTTRSNHNQLKIKKQHFFKNRFISRLLTRSLPTVGAKHFSPEELATIVHLPDKSLVTISNIAWGKILSGEPPEALPIIKKSDSDEHKRRINVFAETEFKNQTVKYGLLREDRRRHLYVVGKTGTGKSTLLANMAINDLKNDEGMVIIDPHGDLADIILEFIPSHRINDVVYFNPVDFKERVVRISLFEGENIQHRELISSGIISIFQKLYGYSWGPRLEYILRNALLTLLCLPQARLSDVIRLLTDTNFRQSVVEKVDDPVLKNYWLNEYNQLSERLRSESISSILNKIGQFVSSPLVRNVVDAQKSSFNVSQVINEGKILIANLSQGKLGEDNATLLGAMLITKIQLAAMSRADIPEEQRRDCYLFVDEFQNFATDSFVKILSEARKYRLNLTLANQYMAQIPESVQKAIFGNCGSIVSFVMGADDATTLQQEYGNLYSPDDLVNLSRYQIVNKISISNTISRPFPAKTLPPLSNSNSNKDKVIKVSRERYAR